MIYKKDGFYLIQLFDRIDRELMASAYISVLNQEEFKQNTHTLWDFRESMVDLSFDDIQKNAELLVESFSSQRTDCARSAFIVSDLSDRGILQTYVTAVSHYPVEFKLFNNYQDGVIWLLE